MKIKRLLILFLSMFLLTSCSSKIPSELKQANKLGQYVELSYIEFDEKISKSESFVFFIRKKDCSSCANFYPIVKDVLELNSNFIIYSLDIDELESTEQIVLSSMFYTYLGRDYYSMYEYKQTQLYTPSIAMVENGQVRLAKIGVIDNESLIKFYEPNFIYVDTYYEYNQQILITEEFDLILSNGLDNELYEQKRKESISGTNKVVYLNYENFTENYKIRLLNRINYYLGEENKIDDLPSVGTLSYKDGAIVGYKEGIDEE